MDEILRTAGLDLARPVFFVWEGVTQYLDATAVDATLRYVATAATGSKLLFTYVDSGALRPDAAGFAVGDARIGQGRGAARLFLFRKLLGEPARGLSCGPVVRAENGTR